MEYKGGLVNNGRQAILDSAAMQAVNRALGLANVKNHAFSVRHSKVDIITSWWEEAGAEGYQYRFNRHDNAFTLDTPIGWFRFYSFLCRLRTYHQEVSEALWNTSPSSSLLAAHEFFSPKKLTVDSGTARRRQRRVLKARCRMLMATFNLVTRRLHTRRFRWKIFVGETVTKKTTTMILMTRMLSQEM
ncbi:hypothetical protein C8J57DRAFT_316846 [Mycena rebaudengoi]|nr:hypothetical protein C8J57DRAFT_316846 [Mycena rebaudengoi]